jgi:Fe-S cluster assembly protein SufD
MTPALESYVAEAERVGAGRRRTDADWLTRIRRDAIERFQSLGFPTLRDEEWRFTSVAPIAEGRFELAHDGVAGLSPSDLAPFEFAGPAAATLVFVNGRYVPAASARNGLPAGVRVGSLARALADDAAGLEGTLNAVSGSDPRAFTALNTAFLADGAFVHVPDSTIVEPTIHLLFLTVGDGKTMSHPRVLVQMGAHSQATIVESYGGLRADTYFTNAVTELVAGDQAVLQHYKVQRETPSSFHMAGMYIHASRAANVASHSMSLGGSLVRNDIIVVLDGEGAHCTLNGLYVTDGSRLVDNHTTIVHAQPHCDSREVYKGILADRSRAVFNGKIVVRPDAQKTDAKQTNKALLLSEDAQINTKPQLEIFANDVKCTHGAAVGQMDDEAIFYLRARGLGYEEARHMLVRAFAGDVVNHLPLAPLRTRIEAELDRRLAEWRV